MSRERWDLSELLAALDALEQAGTASEASHASCAAIAALAALGPRIHARLFERLEALGQAQLVAPIRAAIAEGIARGRLRAMPDLVAIRKAAASMLPALRLDPPKAVN